MTLDEAVQNLRVYEQDTDPLRTIRDTITGAYDSLRPELETIHKYETEQLPSFYDAFSGFGMGTGAADMDPLTRLQSATGDVARKGALARTSRDIFDVRKSRMEDLIRDTYGQWQTGYGAAQNAWQRAWAQKQHEDQMALAREQMAAAQRASSSGGWNPPSQGVPNLQPVITGIKGFLDTKVGGDGRVSPSTFKTAQDMFNQQLQSVGFNPIDTRTFANIYQDYINPSHGWQYIGMDRPQQFGPYRIEDVLSGYGTW